MFIWSFGLDLVGLKKGIFLYYKNSFLWTKFYYNTLTFKIITRKAKLLLKKKHYQENLLQKTDGQLENIDKLVWQFSNYCLCQYSMLCCILLYYLFVLYICIDLYVYTFIELRGLEKKLYSENCVILTYILIDVWLWYRKLKYVHVYIHRHKTSS